MEDLIAQNGNRIRRRAEVKQRGTEVDNKEEQVYFVQFRILLYEGPVIERLVT